jgi:hypothetical protein
MTGDLDPADPAAIRWRPQDANKKRNTRKAEMSRRRFFGTSDRDAFYTALRVMRDACIAVCRAAPIKGLDYRTASELKDRIDDAVEALTGNRQALWLQPHGGATRQESRTTVLQIETDAEEKEG